MSMTQQAPGTKDSVRNGSIMCQQATLGGLMNALVGVLSAKAVSFHFRIQYCHMNSSSLQAENTVLFGVARLKYTYRVPVCSDSPFCNG